MELIRDNGRTSKIESEGEEIQDIPRNTCCHFQQQRKSFTYQASGSLWTDTKITHRYFYWMQMWFKVFITNSKSRRLEINTTYWNLCLHMNKSFVVKHSFHQNVKRRHVKSVNGVSYDKCFKFQKKMSLSGIFVLWCPHKNDNIGKIFWWPTTSMNFRLWFQLYQSDDVYYQK